MSALLSRVGTIRATGFLWASPPCTSFSSTRTRGITEEETATVSCMSINYTGLNRGSVDVPWVGPARSNSDSSWCLVTDEEQEVSQEPVQPVVGGELWAPGKVPSLSVDLVVKRRLLGTVCLDNLDVFGFPELACLYSHQQLSDLPSLSKLRVHRALRAGLSARDKLDGRVRATVSSPLLPQTPSTTWYVCLRCQAFPSGFLTEFYRIYASKVIDRRGNFEVGSISHSFNSLVEVAAYLAGASAQWPVELQQ